MVVSSKLQIKLQPESARKGAQGAAQSRRPERWRAHPVSADSGFLAPPPSGPADLHRPLGPKPRRQEPCVLRFRLPERPRRGSGRVSAWIWVRPAASGPAGAAGREAGRPGRGRSGGRGREPAPNSPSAGWPARPWRSTSRPFAMRRVTWSGDTR